jgi:hypothetical protein
MGFTSYSAAVVSGSYLCAPTSYAPSLTSLTTTSATLAAVSSANVNTGAFTAPASGNVVVTVTLAAKWSANVAAAFCLAQHGSVTPVCNSVVFGDSAASETRAYSMQFLVTGLTSGSSNNFDLLFAIASADTLTVVALGIATTTPTGNFGAPVTMTVQAV